MDTNSYNHEQDLWEAAWQGHLEPIYNAIDNCSFDVNWQYHYRDGRYCPPNTMVLDEWMIHTGDLNGSTLLHIACFRGHVSLVGYLLSRGADSTIRNAFGRAPVDMTTTELNTCSPDSRSEIASLLKGC